MYLRWGRLSNCCLKGHLQFPLSPPAISGLTLYKEPQFQLCSVVNFNTKDARFEYYKAAFLQQGKWFIFGLCWNLQVPIQPGNRRCATRHFEIYPKGCGLSQNVGYEKRPNSPKSWQRSDQRVCHGERRNQVHTQTNGGSGLTSNGRPGRIQAN